MFIEFQELIVKNILSYGGKPTTIKFTEGLNSITGSNGAGKSSFLDALSFCLYGVPYRKIKLAKLVNRKNKNKLFTQLKFKNNEDQYRITRTLDPTDLVIEKNNNVLDKHSSKKLDQEELNKIIGIDHNLFKHLIGLAVNYNKPFLGLPLQEKRSLIESIFNIKIFGDMLISLKNKQKGLKTEKEIFSKHIVILTREIDNLKKYIKDLEETKKNFNSIKEIKLKGYNNEVTLIEDKLTSYEVNYNSALKKKNSYLELIKDSKNDSSKLNGYKLELMTNNNRIKFLEDTIALYKNSRECPTCSSTFTEDIKKSRLNSLKTEIKGIVNLNEELLKEQVPLLESIKIREDTQKKLTYLDREFDKFYLKKDNLENQLKRIIAHRDSLLNEEFNVDINSFKNDLKQKVIECTELKDNLAKVSKNIIDNEIIAEILSEKGIKSFFLNNLLPNFNKRINEYLNKFKLPIIILFDEFMEEKITSYTGYLDYDYMGFSQGEKKRCDISILLSFIDIAKEISNWDCNLLFIDELLDGGTDDEGLESMIESLAEMVYESQQLCIYLISHKLINKDYFKSKIEITKTANFSTIKYLE